MIENIFVLMWFVPVVAIHHTYVGGSRQCNLISKEVMAAVFGSLALYNCSCLACMFGVAIQNSNAAEDN